MEIAVAPSVQRLFPFTMTNSRKSNLLHFIRFILCYSIFIFHW